MQALVYIFIALAAGGLGATAYFGLTFTPIEAALAALVFAVVAVLLMERTLRQRAEARLEKAIEDLSRLLATDAQAGQVLGQRINALSDINSGKRLEALEADVSVLGTVVRQIAEAVAELEEARQQAAEAAAAPVPAKLASPSVVQIAEPAIPLPAVRRALEDERLLFHIKPVLTLPQRRVHGYDLVPRLVLENGEIAFPADFLPRRGGEDILRRIGTGGVAEAITITRRARANGAPMTLFSALPRALLSDQGAVDGIVAELDASRGVSQGVSFVVEAGDWSVLSPRERGAVTALTGKGAGLTLAGATTLRIDWGDLADAGVRAVRIDAGGFLSEPHRFTDFHPADVAAYTARFGIDLVATGVAAEHEVIALLENGFAFAQGPHLGRAGPVRPDLLASRPAPVRRAEGG